MYVPGRYYDCLLKFSGYLTGYLHFAWNCTHPLQNFQGGEIANLAGFFPFKLLPAKTLKKLTTEIFIPLKLKELIRVGVSARIANGICKTTGYPNFLMLIFYLRSCNLELISSPVPSPATTSQMLKPGLKTFL